MSDGLVYQAAWGSDCSEGAGPLLDNSPTDHSWATCLVRMKHVPQLL